MTHPFPFPFLFISWIHWRSHIICPVHRCIFSHSVMSNSWLLHGHLFYESEKWKVKVAQSCPTLCDPMDYIVHGILQARILEWVAFPFSRGSSQPRSPALQADSLPAEPPGKPLCSGFLPWLHIRITWETVKAPMTLACTHSSYIESLALNLGSSSFPNLNSKYLRDEGRQWLG